MDTFRWDDGFTRGVLFRGQQCIQSPAICRDIPAFPAHSQDLAGICEDVEDTDDYEVFHLKGDFLKRPPYIAFGDSTTIEEHFPQERVPRPENMTTTDWCNRVRALNNLLSSVIYFQQFKDRTVWTGLVHSAFKGYQLRILLREIAYDAVSEELLFWTPDHNMLDEFEAFGLNTIEREEVKEATLIVHLMQFYEDDDIIHFSIIIYDQDVRQWLFVDCGAPWEKDLYRRYFRAAEQLREWLTRSGICKEDITVEDVWGWGSVVEHLYFPKCINGLVEVDFVRSFMRENVFIRAYNTRQCPATGWKNWLLAELAYPMMLKPPVPEKVELDSDDYPTTVPPCLSDIIKTTDSDFLIASYLAGLV
ncbi:hypothetical protein F4815DRAFT_450452 [Daldinia loculata]|nr:hypothetical protein F4815DRAFT_450452 [Daldinia loculata]